MQESQAQETQELVQKYNKVCFLNPMYKMIPTQFHQSMLGLVTSLFQHGFKVSGIMTDSSVIPICRNSLVEVAHTLYEEERPDLYLWVDSDQVFNFNHFMHLLYHYDMSDEVHVLAARYLIKNMEAPGVCAYVRGKNGSYCSISPNLTNIQEVDAVGLGFCLVSPKLMEDMYAKHGKRQFMFTWEGDGVLGEDFYWCNLVRELGHKVYVDNTVTVGHYGVPLDESFLINFRKKN